MIKRLTGIFLLAFLYLPYAQAVDIGVGLKAGTLGAGVDVSIALTKNINARLSLTSIDAGDEEETIEVGDDGSTADVDAELDLDFGATAILFDWYVFDGGFHLTAGFMRNDSELSIAGRLTGDIVVDGQALSSSDIDGDITGDVSLGESFQPYIGVGWGRKAGSNGGLSFTAEIGIAMLDPAADLEAELATGSGLSQAELDDRIKGIEDDADDELDDFEAWPVLSIGINYAF